jgi:hypothetical protein
MISTLLNLAGVLLVLPGCLLALGFLAVQFVAERRPVELFDALRVLLDWLPPPERIPLWFIAAVVAGLAVAAAMLKVPWLLPLLVLLFGVASATYTHWVAGHADVGTDPILWLNLLGIGASAWQLDRYRRHAPR